MEEGLAWLLDPDEPAVRARALVDLLGRSADDPEVREARRDITERGAAARMLDELAFAGRDEASLYRPKYGAPYHRLVALAEMGVTARDPRAAELLEVCLDAFYADWGDQEVCLTGNLARSALLMERGEDPRVQRAIDWLVAAQKSDGGWHCFPSDEGTLDAWEALAAFAALPPARRPREATARGVEFLLSRGLGLDADYEPWRRLHWPRHYYYDVLVGLELATTLGDAKDERLRPALDWLESMRRADGRWQIDAQHPDLGPGADYTLRDAASVRPLVVEPEGAPSKWATLAALRVLRRAGRA